MYDFRPSHRCDAAFLSHVYRNLKNYDFKTSTSYKITKVNLEIAFPEAKINEIELMSKLSIRESIISGYETVYTWGRRDFDSNNHIFKVENNFLLNSLAKQDQGLIALAFHNRSVDMLLKWINSQVKTISLYK